MKKICTLITLFFTIISFNQIAAQVNTQDSLALAALYRSTNGDDWSNNSGWLTSPVNNWQGVTVEDNRVVKIELGQNSLTGTLSDSIRYLSALTSLQLYSNKIEGNINPNIGDLIAMGDLSFDDNMMEGEIPSSIGNLQNCYSLSLGHNNFSGEIPSTIPQMLKLGFLGLSDNQLEGELPMNFTNLVNLTFLFLNENKLSGSLPENMGNLNKLTSLYFSDNKFSGVLPMSLCQIASLTALDIQNNNFDESSCLSFLCLKELLSGLYFEFDPQQDGQFTFAAGCASSTAEVSSTGLLLMPNPTKNYLFLKGLSEDVEIQIFDLTGKEVLHLQHKGGTSRSLKLSHLHKGLYFLKIHGPDQNLTKKFHIL